MHSIFLPLPPSPSSSSSSPPITRRPHPRIIPTPRSGWPFWTHAIAKFRHAEDTGLGDTLVHLIGDARSARFKKWFARKFGKTCGCTERQRWLNQKFPYPN